jgi:recombination protein RecA
VLDLAVVQNVVDKSGAWFSYKGDRLGQGRENSKQLLKEKPEILGRIEREVKVKLGMRVREEKAEAAPSAKAAAAEKK